MDISTTVRTNVPTTLYTRTLPLQRYHIHVDDMNHMMYMERSYDVVWGGHIDDMMYMEREEEVVMF